ncbi:MAG: 2Fe-2S iron-sulfur cluster-binding protein [Lachnospiraceae bacterium]
MFMIEFRFENSAPVKAYAHEGEKLPEVARKNNVEIRAPCSGNASCGKCRVRLIGGTLKSEKTRHITEEEYAEGWRLSCVRTISGDVEHLVPDIASAYRSRMKVADLSTGKEIEIFEEVKQSIVEAGIELKNDYFLLELEMDPPSLDDTMPDNERLLRAVEAATGRSEIRMAYSALRKLPDALRKGDFKVQCVIRNRQPMFCLWM